MQFDAIAVVQLSALKWRRYVDVDEKEDVLYVKESLVVSGCGIKTAIAWCRQL